MFAALNVVEAWNEISWADAIPFTLVLIGLYWVKVKIDSSVAGVTKNANLAAENRRYIQEVVIPSYEISDNWDNPHYNNWLKAGGWKD